LEAEATMSTDALVHMSTAYVTSTLVDWVTGARTRVRGETTVV
jgi:hypothetical protein